MNTSTKKLLYITGAALGLVVLSSFATVGVLSLREDHHPSTEDSPVVAAATPTPPPAPVAPAVQAPPPPPMAQVISVNPHYVTVSKPQKHCYQKPQTIYPQPNNTPPLAGAVVGGVAGGLAGSAIKGNSHNAAIVAGAALGALSGGAIQKNINKPQPQTVYVTQCTTKNVSSKVQKGYEVTYFFNGQQGMILMDNPPASNMIPPPYMPVPYAAPAAAPAPAPAPTAPTTGQPAYY